MTFTYGIYSQFLEHMSVNHKVGSISLSEGVFWILGTTEDFLILYDNGM